MDDLITLTIDNRTLIGLGSMLLLMTTMVINRLIGLITASIERSAATTFSYEVEPVCQAAVGEYERLYPLAPTLEAFAKAVLECPEHASHHEDLRKKIKRCNILYPGMALYVRNIILP